MIPKYEVIKQDIIRMIEENEFKPGSKIYSEGELKNKYQVSNTTVVKALNDLVLSGYLIRKQGEGTFVRRSFKHRQVFLKENGPLSKLELQQPNGAVEESITEITTDIKNKEIAKYLQVPVSEKIIKLNQIALVNDKIWKVQERYVVAKNLKKGSLENLKKGSSLSKELNLSVNLTVLPMKMAVNVQTISRGMKENHHFKKLLDDSNNDYLAVFVVDKITYNSDGKPLEYTKYYIHPDYYSIELQTGGNL